MKLFSIIIIPIFVLFVVFVGFFKKINVYSSFLNGAKDGLKIVFDIIPAIIAMVFATNIFMDSGVLNILNPISKIFMMPKEILPMIVLRPISGTASMNIMVNVFSIYGPDSFTGKLASVIQGCTDTTIYTIALYYSSVKITKTRYTIIVGLIADAVGIIVGIVLTNIFF